MLLLIVVLSVVGLCHGDCTCTSPLTHYEEMGCKPVYTSDKCCPAYFDCEQFQGRTNSNCYYKGQTYNIGDRVDDKLTGPNCLAGCFCRENSKFTCAHIDCPEFLGGSPIRPGCHRTYKLDFCCSNGQNCPPFDNLAKCVVDGKTYYEGQRFSAPGRNDLSCLCGKNFAGKFEEPFCRSVHCGIELLHSDDFKNKCAPVYYGNDGICPIQWQCNENVMSIQIAKDSSTIDKKCKFMDKELNVGDKILLNRPYKYSPEINCECKVPPIVTCIQKPHET